MSGRSVVPAGRTNRLADESSPYLLQHARNPVEWYPWGPEAFEAARQRQVPIFLSVGYSTCYWCHVMERECFENPDIAAVMNERFVCIKVDREERPDVDDLYMTAVQLLTGRGGWPMSVFLTPPPPEGESWTGLQPFWGGTYFPPEPRDGMQGFPQILEALSDAWRDRRDDVLTQATRVAEAVTKEMDTAAAPRSLGREHLSSALSALLRIADSATGGFGSAPKFPQPVYAQLLMDARDSVESEEGRQSIDAILSLTLDRMAMGGIYDQVGGGFHRYSTDARWLVPHFEKMLYDNGQLASLYAEAADATDNAYFGEIAGEICDYVLREMRHEGGAFFSAQDAEVDHREGQNYLWTPQEVERILVAAGRADLVEFALYVYNLDGPANFRDPHAPEEPASWVLALRSHPQALAEQLKLTREEVDFRLVEVNAHLLQVRQRRKQPATDDKILASWNGLMIAGLADSGRVLERPELIEAAAAAWTFIDGNMRDESGALLRSWRNGPGRIAAFCEDYAFLIHGLLRLHDATGDTAYLDAARTLAEEAQTRYFDASWGGYSDVAQDASDLFVRPRSIRDGALPSANSVMLHNLIDLHEASGESAYLDSALDLLEAISPVLSRHPVAAANSARALLRLLGLAPERVAEIGAGSPQPPPPVESDSPAPLTWRLASQAVAFNEDGIATATLIIEIAEGFHLNAPDPGVEGLVGLSIELLSGEGAEIEIDYPEPSTLTLAGDTLAVYEGTLHLPVRLRRIAPENVVSDAFGFVVAYQLCDDQRCLAPATASFRITIEAP